MRTMIATLLVALIFATGAFAEGNIGVSYSEILEDRALGVTGAYNTALSERVSFEVDASIQSGDVHNAVINTDFIFDIATIDLKLLIANKLKGYSLDTLGRDQSIGLAFSVPIDTINVDVGIGGASSSPFNPPTAFDALVAEGFNESEISGKGLGSITPAPTGIPFRNGNTLNAFLSTGFEAGIFDIEMRGVVELLGEGDKMNQLITTLKTGGKVYDLNLTTAIDISLADYQDVIHREIATITTVGFDF